MERRYLFAAIVSLALITLCFSYFDVEQAYSSKYLLWDSLEHLLGGLTVGFFALFGISLIVSKPPAVAVVALVFSVGVAWEIMEVQIGTGGSPFMSYWADTIKDIICDCVGGYSAVAIARHL